VLPLRRVGRGGTIVASEPLRVASPHDEPFALLDDVPAIDGRSAPPDAIGGGWFGWLGYRLAASVEQVPLAHARPVPLPDFHLAYYDHIVHQDRYGSWWFEALATPERWSHLEERLEHVSAASSRRALPRRPPRRRYPPRCACSARSPPTICRPSPRAVSGSPPARSFKPISAYDSMPGMTAPRARCCAARSKVESSRIHAAFDTPQGGVVSLSPELFLRRQGRRVRSGPIKGTADRPAIRRSRPSRCDACGTPTRMRPST